MKFSQKMPLYFFYAMMQKSQQRPKIQIKGVLLKLMPESGSQFSVNSNTSAEPHHKLSAGITFNVTNLVSAMFL